MYLEGLISEGLIQSEICVLKKYSAKTCFNFSSSMIPKCTQDLGSCERGKIGL